METITINNEGFLCISSIGKTFDVNLGEITGILVRKYKVNKEGLFEEIKENI